MTEFDSIRDQGRSIVVTYKTRVCLAGENLDWLGLHTLTSTIDLKIVGSLCVTGGKGVHFISEYPGGREETVLYPDEWPAVRPDGADQSSFQATCEAAMRAVLSRSGKSIPVGVELDLRSSIPIAGGMASSGSLHVAITDLLFQACLGERLSDGGQAELAYASEHDELGIPCGRMDQYAIVIGGVQLQDHSPSGPPHIEQLNLPNDAAMVVAYPRTSSRFAIHAEDLARRSRERDPGFLSFVRTTDELVHSLANTLREGRTNSLHELESLGGLLDAAQQTIEHLLGPPELQIARGLSLCRDAGAFGAKTLGMRTTGGCALALAPLAAVSDVVMAFESVGLETYVQHGKPNTTI